MKNSTAEALLITLLKLDFDRLSTVQRDEVADFLKYNEWGLAYDVLVFAVTNASYFPSEEALALLRQTAETMGIEYPNLSS
jgi:hypothetical protein